MQEMTEREAALKIAEDWLDFKFAQFTAMVPGEPDCDACVIARQYKNAIEQQKILKIMLASLAELTSGMLQRIDLRDIPTVAHAEDLMKKIIDHVRQEAA
jgi:hypothetical protein